MKTFIKSKYTSTLMIKTLIDEVSIRIVTYMGSSQSVCLKARWHVWSCYQIVLHTFAVWTSSSTIRGTASLLPTIPDKLEWNFDKFQCRVDFIGKMAMSCCSFLYGRQFSLAKAGHGPTGSQSHKKKVTERRERVEREWRGFVNWELIIKFNNSSQTLASTLSSISCYGSENKLKSGNWVAKLQRQSFHWSEHSSTKSIARSTRTWQILFRPFQSFVRSRHNGDIRWKYLYFVIKYRIKLFR